MVEGSRKLGSTNRGVLRKAVSISESITVIHDTMQERVPNAVALQAQGEPGCLDTLVPAVFPTYGSHVARLFPEKIIITEGLYFNKNGIQALAQKSQVPASDSGFPFKELPGS
jgi:hypothetical protein